MEYESMSIEQLRAEALRLRTEREAMERDLTRVTKQRHETELEVANLRGQIQALENMHEYVFDHMEKN